MHHYRLVNNVIVLITVFITVVCTNEGSSKSSEQKPAGTTQKEISAEENIDWTDTVIGSWNLRLHGPGPAGQHPVWEGPVEIGSKPGGYFCNLDLELVDSIWAGSQNNILMFRGFSGSKTFNFIVNVDSCSFVTKRLPPSGSE